MFCLPQCGQSPESDAVESVDVEPRLTGNGTAAADVEVPAAGDDDKAPSMPNSTAVFPAAAQGVSKVQVFKYIDRTKAAPSLSWDRLCFRVAAGKRGNQGEGKKKSILKEVTGDLRPGELTAILGPSGSGKTSLLNILAGRVRKGGRFKAEIPGQIRLNDTPFEPSAHQTLVGYVMQDDALLGTMTPREVLQFSAHLRLQGVDKSEQNELVEDVIASLKLTRCADTMVGNELIKGISGGERKRTAVGAELITNPHITFLDEPTSGLDTAAAFIIISVLRQLTEAQQSVLCTIHQPSSEIFHLFDQAIFLVQGEVAYHGPPKEIRTHFDSIGYGCPQDYNPADFVMFLVQAEDDSQRTAIVDGWSNSTSKRPRLVGESSEVESIPARRPRKGFCTQLVALAKREIKNTYRDKGTLGSRFGITLFLTSMVSLIFFRIGSRNLSESFLVKRDSYDLQSHMGALTMIGIQSMFGSAMPTLLTFASERPVFLREHASNMYGVFPYFLSKTATELPLLVLQNLLMFLLAYWLLALQGQFFFLVGSTTLVSMASVSTALLAACLLSDAKQAMEVAPALYVPQILFAGFFIKMQLVPVWMRWLQYVCSLKWGMNLLLLTEFGDDENSAPILESNDIEQAHAIYYVAALLGIFACFRLIAMVVLVRRAKAFYN